MQNPGSDAGVFLFDNERSLDEAKRNPGPSFSRHSGARHLARARNDE
jgi:hypothetical protein